MNRKQVLKQMKKDKKNSILEEENNYVSHFLTSIFIILIAFILCYLFVGVFVTKTIKFNDDKDEKKEEVKIDNDTILAGQIFNQKGEEYYVLIYDVSDKDLSFVNWKSKYESGTDALKVYVVDSKEKLNSKYIVTKDSNKNPTGYNDLKIVSPTLIKISDKKVVEYTEGEEEIKNVFKK